MKKKYLIINLTLFYLLISGHANNATLHFNQGNQYYHQQSYERAIEEYSKAIAYDAADFDAFNNRGIAYYQIGLYDLAIRDFTTVIQSQPDDIFAYQSRAISYNTIGKHKLAHKDYQKVIRINPDFAYSHFAILYTSYYISKKDFKNAYLDFSLKLGQLKKKQWVYAISLYITRQINEKELISRAGKNKSHLNDAYFTIGFNHLRKHRKKRAKKYFLACRELNLIDSPEYFLAKLELSRL